MGSFKAWQLEKYWVHVKLNPLSYLTLSWIRASIATQQHRTAPVTTPPWGAVLVTFLDTPLFEVHAKVHAVVGAVDGVIDFQKALLAIDEGRGIHVQRRNVHNLCFT